MAPNREGDVVSNHAALALHGPPLRGRDAGRIDLLTDVGQVVRCTGSGDCSVCPGDGEHSLPAVVPS